MIRLRNTYAEIHLPNLHHNFSLLKALGASTSFFCPMIKADAYGHGDIEIAKHLEKSGANWLGVSLVEEGVRLRNSGVSASILCFAFFDQIGAEEIVRYRLTPVLGSWDQVEKLKRACEGDAALPVHVKFNTGMSRLGFEPEEATQVAEMFQKTRHFKLEGVCTHLLNGEDASDPAGRTAQQYRIFESVTEKFPGVQVHAMNSASMLAISTSKSSTPFRFQNRQLGARPGISIYGVWPEISKHAHIQLRPVMQLKSSIGLVRHVPPQRTVSYGARWTAKRDSIIGIIPIGYADGYPRAFTNCATMLYRGRHVPVVGTVCMDYSMVDLTDVVREGTMAQAGEEVVLFGEQLIPTNGSTGKPSFGSVGVDDLARLIGTISYEILTQIGKRIPRVYIHEY